MVKILSESLQYTPSGVAFFQFDCRINLTQEDSRIKQEPFALSFKKAEKKNLKKYNFRQHEKYNTTNTPGEYRDLGAGQGRQREGRADVGTTAGAGTQHRVQRRVVEAIRWRLWETSIWTAHRASRVGGERVWQIGAATTNGY